ncbi:40S ribosomal protein S3a [Galemys pyrenaicus]|uniref:40S ribosomal protein S3a n=1 Tax=Galemys pyrenaicus TaxID=202257 RepID=A0A8J6DIM1_GALPY|nr:40S ribosomal protein S3a [Galemys pyrenaicus]
MKDGRKGVKKKVVDPFYKKDWYDVKAPSMFNESKSHLMASRVMFFEMNLADLQNDEITFRKLKLSTEDVQDKNCPTNFHGMDLTQDKMCSMVKKWQTVIEAHVDVKTMDGYLLHLFCVGFT